MIAILCVCFALSGAAALALEVLWMRSAGLVLGATAPTAATVFACYFAGLTIGAVAVRRGVRNPIQLYGGLELGAAAGAALSVAIFELLLTDAGQRVLAESGAPGRVAVVTVTILPATICFGATLPVLGQVVTAAGAAVACCTASTPSAPRPERWRPVSPSRR
jgi:hypothetical protein